MLSRGLIKPKAYALPLVLAPVLNTYVTSIPLLTLGEIVLFIMALSMLWQSPRNTFTSGNGLFFFTVYSIVITLLSMMLYSGIYQQFPYKEITAFIVYIALLFIIGKRIDLNVLKKMYVETAYVFALFLILQFVVHLLTGRWIPGLIPGLPSSFTRGTSELLARMNRASSVFKEPAHYAQYTAIPLALQMYKENKTHRDWRILIVLAISLFLTFSGNGLLVLAIVGVYYMIYIGKTKNLISGLLIFAAGLVLVLILANRSEAFSKLLGRIINNEIIGGNSARYSGYIRILRGYLVYGRFGFAQKLFGVGIGLYPAYSMKYCYDILTAKTMLELDYVNGFQYYLVSVGIVGACLYMICFLKSFTKKTVAIKCITFLFVGLILISGVFRGTTWLLFAIIILAEARENQHNTLYI